MKIQTWDSDRSVTFPDDWSVTAFSVIILEVSTFFLKAAFLSGRPHVGNWQTPLKTYLTCLTGKSYQPFGWQKGKVILAGEWQLFWSVAWCFISACTCLDLKRRKCIMRMREKPRSQNCRHTSSIIRKLVFTDN